MKVAESRLQTPPNPRGITESDIARAASAAEAEGKTLELVDGLEPGLRLRIKNRSGRWYVLAKTEGGVRSRIPLGAWPSVGVRDARSAARTIRQSLALTLPDRDDGSGSVGAIFDRYQARRLSQLRKGLVMGRAIAAAFDGLRHRELSSLTRKEISQLVDDMADRAPIGANRTLAYVKAFFSWAVGRGYLEVDPARGISKPSREIARERTPDLAELAQIWAAADELGYPFGHVTKLLMLTAARREEVGSMRVVELDLPVDASDGCWTIPAERSKNGRAIRVPLSSIARAVVETALSARPKDSPYVFSTTTKTSVSGWSRAKQRLDKMLEGRSQARKAASPEPWRFHDLRRSFATYACDTLGVDPAVADRCLNHVGSSTTSTISRVYARNEMYSQRRDALDRWAQLVEQAVASWTAFSRPLG